MKSPICVSNICVTNSKQTASFSIVGLMLAIAPLWLMLAAANTSAYAQTSDNVSKASATTTQHQVFVPGNASGYFGNPADIVVPFISAITVQGPATISVSYVSGTVLDCCGVNTGPNGASFNAEGAQMPLQEADGVAGGTVDNLDSLIGVFVPAQTVGTANFKAIDGTKNVTPAGIVPCGLFFIGEGKTFDVGYAGTLFLGINDFHVSDNGGGFTVEVSATGDTNQSADLFLRIQPTPTTVHQGDLLTYAFPVWNLGPDNAVHEVLNTQVPEGTTLDYVRISGTPGLGTCTTPPYGGTGQIVCYENGSMAPNTTWTVRLTVKVTAATGSTITANAATMSDTPDPNLANNTATVSTTVLGNADLFLRVLPSTTTVHQGDLITYAFPVWNLGLAKLLSKC
jgi:Domain of unknown function DUF11